MEGLRLIERVETLTQCQACGKLHTAKVIKNEEGIYKIWCSDCQDVVTHLDLESEENKYLYININLDKRYY